MLSFIQRELAIHDNVVVVPFNPWGYTSDETLLLGFFKVLTTAIDRRFTSRTEDLGRIIEEYGSLATELVKFKIHEVEISAHSNDADQSIRSDADQFGGKQRRTSPV